MAKKKADADVTTMDETVVTEPELDLAAEKAACLALSDGVFTVPERIAAALDGFSTAAFGNTLIRFSDSAPTAQLAQEQAFKARSVLIRADEVIAAIANLRDELTK
jgi:hypothetical protein